MVITIKKREFFPVHVPIIQFYESMEISQPCPALAYFHLCIPVWCSGFFSSIIPMQCLDWKNKSRDTGRKLSGKHLGHHLPFLGNNLSQSSSIVQVALLAAQSQRHALPDFPHIPDMPHTSGLLHTPQLCLGGKWSNEKGKWLGAAMYLRHIFANVRGLGKHLGMGPVWVKLGTPSIW